MEEMMMQELQDILDVMVDMEESDSYDINGVKLPRVTRIVNTCNTNLWSLLQWSNRLGIAHKEYSAYMKKASSMGTAIHKAIEDYITAGIDTPKLNELADASVNESILMAFDGFKIFWDRYKSTHNTKTIEVERKLHTPTYAGTMDLHIVEADGTETIYDFKSSNHVQPHHFVQLAAYQHGLMYETGNQCNIKKVGILQLDKYKVCCNEFVLDLEIPDNAIYMERCWKAFCGMLYAYMNSLWIDKNFSTVLVGGS